MQYSLKKFLTWYLISAMFVIGVAPRVYAGFSPSEALVLSSQDRALDLQKVQKFLEMKMVRERFREFGLTTEEIQTRLGQLSDAQLHQLALKLDDLKVGGDSGLGIIIALLIIAILVVILIQITGHHIVIRKS